MEAQGCWSQFKDGAALDNRPDARRIEGSRIGLDRGGEGIR
jgi:hypothetical protein